MNKIIKLWEIQNNSRYRQKNLFGIEFKCSENEIQWREMFDFCTLHGNE